MSRLTRNRTAEPVSRDQILSRERGQGNIIFPCIFPCSAEQDWQPNVDPYSSYMCLTTKFSLSMKMSRLTRNRTAEPVSRDQILSRERGQGNIIFPCSAEQDWQPNVDPYSSYMCLTIYVSRLILLYVWSSHIARVWMNRVRLPIMRVVS